MIWIFREIVEYLHKIADHDFPYTQPVTSNSLFPGRLHTPYRNTR